jgi:hypothetical protein
MCTLSRSRAWQRLCGVFIVSFCVLLPHGLRAQSSETEVGEMAAFGGLTLGLGTTGAVGASSGTAFSKYALGLIEVAFSPVGNTTLRHRIGPPVENSRLFDFNGSFHIRIPVRKRWAPYGIVGGGILFDSFRAIPTRPPENGDTTTPAPPPVVFAVDEFNFGFHTGGGLRYYIREDWGIRPEFKVVISNRTYTRFTIGIFVNVSSDWFL